MKDEKVLKCETCGVDIVWRGQGRKKQYCLECAEARRIKSVAVAQAKQKLKKSSSERKKQLREYMREYMRDYYRDEENREKHMMRVRTNHLLRAGRIKMADCCALCQAVDDLQVHHISYTKQLAEYAIVTLCRKCHGEVHAKINEEERQ